MQTTAKTDFTPHGEKLQLAFDVFTEGTAITENVLTSPSRKQEVSMTRQCIWYVLNSLDQKEYSVVRLARIFNRSHSTVVEGIQNIRSFCAYETDFFKPYKRRIEEFFEEEN